VDGHRLLAIAEKMETLGLSVVETIRAVPSEPSDRVRLATMEGIAAFYLAEKLTDFNAIHPDIVVELVTERHLINLTKREADVSINFGPPVGSRLNERKAGTFKLGLFGSAAHLEHRGIPQTVENLPSHDFVDYIVDLVAIPKVHWLLDVLELEHVVIRSSSVDAQQNAIAAGRGLGLLPYFSAKRNRNSCWFFLFTQFERDAHYLNRF
jgi:DNA-binding transcriptional LysR family regulator